MARWVVAAALGPLVASAAALPGCRAAGPDGRSAEEPVATASLDGSPRTEAGARASAEAGAAAAAALDGAPGAEAGAGDALAPAPAIVELPTFLFGDTRDPRRTSATHVGEGCRRGCADLGREARHRVRLAEPAILKARLEPRGAADLHLHLRDAGDRCVDGGQDVIERPLPAGEWDIVVDGPCGGEGEYLLELETAEPLPRRLPPMWNTYYITAEEDFWRGPAEVTLYDARCRPIQKVRRAFYNALCVQGSGVLSDGTVVNYARHCTTRCPRAERCRRYPVALCYQVLDRERYPWGMGKAPRPLVPDWSLAVDPSFVPLDEVLYIRELDGVLPPGKTTPHDGCVATTDTGGGIEGDHFDLFVGTRDRWLAWEKIFRTKSRFRVFRDHPRCFRHRLDPDGDVSRPARRRPASPP